MAGDGVYSKPIFGSAMESRQTVAHGETLVITHIFLGLIKDF
jgi:hypothetical protein